MQNNRNIHQGTLGCIQGELNVLNVVQIGPAGSLNSLVLFFLTSCSRQAFVTNLGRESHSQFLLRKRRRGLLMRPPCFYPVCILTQTFCSFFPYFFFFLKKLRNTDVQDTAETVLACQPGALITWC